MRFRSLALALVLALPTIVACGDSADQSVSGVFPSSAFLGRQVRVEISGDVTEWKQGASVNFGPGVTVQNVTVASPTALFADITVMPDAAPGLRDVTVENSGSKLVLKEAFQLESAIKIDFRGTLAQGSVASFAINNRDFETPFDTTSTGDGFFTPLEYVGVNLAGPAGVTFQVEEVTPFAITGLALIDIDAAPGPFSVESGIDDVVTSNLGTNLEVAARAPMALTSGTPASGMVETSLASALYELDATTAPGLIQFAATSTSAEAAPALALLPASGRFEDLFFYGPSNTFVQLQSSKYYAVFVDLSGTYGYSFTVNPKATQMITAIEAEPNNTTATAANATAIPFLFQTATLSAAADVDWIKITTTAADMGKKIRVKTMGNDPQTDTLVQVFRANGTDAFGNPSADSNYHEDYTSGALGDASGGPGTYWIKVSASPEFVATHNAYIAAVWLE